MSRPALVRRECAWCGDYEDQHDETGCLICGRAPWEKREYRCDKFYETSKEVTSAFEQRRLTIYGHEKGKSRRA